jgi:predicted ABC-type ATPase
MNQTPRLRMFAGPNGSGKSTIKGLLRPELLGVYINPDDIEKAILESGILDFETYGVQVEEREVLEFFQRSSLLHKAGLWNEATSLRLVDGKLVFAKSGVNSYLASVAADFLRRKLIDLGVSFTFETVMSSPDKIEILKLARSRGFRTYLYYVATEDPLINVSRVHHRVLQGGHGVPEDKIVSRYGRSLGLLLDAIRATDRAYIFDNSVRNFWVAEV